MRAAAWTLAILALAWSAGCSKEKFNELVDQAKEQVAEGVDQAKQTVQQQAKAAGQAVSAAGAQAQEELGLAGSMTFSLDAPVATKGCYVAFIPGAGERPSVLQLRSYFQADQETFPSALVQAQVSAKTAAELVGQTLPAQAFIQAEPSGTVWHTVGGEPVQLTIKSLADEQLVAEIAGAVINAATGQATPLSGKVEGALQ